jgi:hypothetical protein
MPGSAELWSRRSRVRVPSLTLKLLQNRSVCPVIGLLGDYQETDLLAVPNCIPNTRAKPRDRQRRRSFVAIAVTRRLTVGVIAPAHEQSRWERQRARPLLVQSRSAWSRNGLNTAVDAAREASGGSAARLGLVQRPEFALHPPLEVVERPQRNLGGADLAVLVVLEGVVQVPDQKDHVCD